MDNMMKFMLIMNMIMLMMILLMMMMKILMISVQDKSNEGENQFSLEKMESTLGELKNIFKQKEKLVDGL